MIVFANVQGSSKFQKHISLFSVEKINYRYLNSCVKTKKFECFHYPLSITAQKP